MSLIACHSSVQLSDRRVAWQRTMSSISLVASHVGQALSLADVEPPPFFSPSTRTPPIYCWNRQTVGWRTCLRQLVLNLTRAPVTATCVFQTFVPGCSQFFPALRFAVPIVSSLTAVFKMCFMRLYTDRQTEDLWLACQPSLSCVKERSQVKYNMQ